MKENQKVILIADLGYGDAGKGTLTDYLSRELKANTIIRYNGGSQAGHNVVTHDGRQHVFSQFGSGTFKGTGTHLSRFMLVDPLSMLRENRHLKELGINDALERTTIEGESPVITPFHQASNRLLTLNSTNRFGSTGRGISEAMADFLNFGKDSLMIADLLDEKTAKKKLQFLRDIQQEKIKDLRADLPKTEMIDEELKVLDDPEIIDYSLDLYKQFISQTEIVDRNYLKKILCLPGSVIFEGAQGVLLDQKYGFYPYITRGNTTFENAEMLLSENDYQGETVKLGVVRVYATRHGAGPFPTEDEFLSDLLPDTFNFTNPWQGNFRVGYLDLLTLKYAIETTGSLDGLAVTHLDKLKNIPLWKICSSYTSSTKLENLNLFFETTDNLIKRIKVNNSTDNLYQQKLGDALRNCTPNYVLSPFQENPFDFVQFIEELIQVPVVVTSSGPTAKDKTIKL